MKKDVFTYPDAFYKRSIRIMEDYVQDAAVYLHLQTGKPFKDCRNWILKKFKDPDNPYQIKDPEVRFLRRGDNGDRKAEVGSFNSYLDDTFAKSQILAPTFTTYTPHAEKVSYLGEYIAVNLGLRKRYKKAMFEAMMRGDTNEERINDSRQSSQKIKNNGLSGAFSSPFTTIYNRTGHSTLTSMTRCITSYGNATNERFLQGNRHYWNPDIVRENIVSITTHSNRKLIESVMEKYQIRPPSVDEVMSAIRRSTEDYWRDVTEMDRIHLFVNTLSDYQRAAYLYTGDAYHLAKYNPHVLREMISALAERIEEPLTKEQSDKVFKDVSDNLIAHVSILCRRDLSGRSLSVTKDEDPVAYGRLGATLLNTLKVLNQYEDLIQAFWITDNLPPTIYNMPSMKRKAVITSDTDSTIFTVSSWLDWYGRGQLDRERKLDISSSMVLVAVENVRHVLAKMSANMGIVGDRVKLLAMKNEFFFPTFCITGRAKHYYATKSVQEGNVYKKLAHEIKGVALRNSNIPKHITQDAHSFMLTLMDDVDQGRDISIREKLEYIVNKEQAIMDEIKRGSPDYLARSRINEKAAYKNPEQSNYLQYTMWKDVFAPKYGESEPPPYRCVKLNAEYRSPKQFQEWLDSLEDTKLAERMRQWCRENGRDVVKTFMIPESIATSRGVPDEILSAADVRKVVAQLMETYYLSMEALGVYITDKNNRRLAADVLKEHLQTAFT